MYIHSAALWGNLKKPVLLFVLIAQICLTRTETVDLASNSNGSTWIVQTNSGPVEGTVTFGLTDQEVYVFYGIPYAEPPIGELRFKPPEPVKQWTEVLQATKQPLPCYQSYNMAIRLGKSNKMKRLRRPWTEDCLKLNILVPKPVIEDAPIIAIIHPGYFQYGSNTYPDGSIITVISKAIVVSMNYRLGAFGFLYFGVPGAPGNVGLLDQKLALHWIQENIHGFGGKSQAVILVGAGNAGAASAGYHLISPESNDLFTTVTVYSGAPLCDWAFQDQETSLKKATSLSRDLGCHDGDIESQLDCLRKAHPEDIIHADSSNTFHNSAQFTPTVDGTFITEPPLDSMKNGHFKKTFLLSLSSIDHGSVPLWEDNFDHISDLKNGVDTAGFQKAVRRLTPTLSLSGMDIVENYYIDKCRAGDSHHIRDATIRVYSDVLFDCCMRLMDEYYTGHGGLVIRSVEAIGKESAPSWVNAPHGLGLEYAFGYPIYDQSFGDVERSISRELHAIVKYSVTKKAAELIKLFQLQDNVNRTYMTWSVTGPEYKTHYRGNHCKMWNDIIPALDKADKTCDTL